MKAYTDYPFEELGDQPYMMAPIREINVISYDGDKYCQIEVGGITTEVKAGYIYDGPGRFDAVSQVKLKDLPQINPVIHGDIFH